jgi:hypothetical protein
MYGTYVKTPTEIGTSGSAGTVATVRTPATARPQQKQEYEKQQGQNNSCGQAIAVIPATSNSKDDSITATTV